METELAALKAIAEDYFSKQAEMIETREAATAANDLARETRRVFDHASTIFSAAQIAFARKLVEGEL